MEDQVAAEALPGQPAEPTVGQHLDDLIGKAQAEKDKALQAFNEASSHLEAMIALKQSIPSRFLSWLKSEFHKLFG